MNKILSNLLDKNKLIYSLKFGFRQNHSTFYALIYLTETIKQSLDQGLFNCDISFDLQKAFDTVNHDIFLGNLEHYRTTRILKLLKKNISTKLVDIFNLSFSSGIYPSHLKTAKVIPIPKKDSKFECSN